MTSPVTIPSEPKKIGLIATMTELLDSTDHRNVLSRLRTNKGAPPLIQGTQSNERPDVFADGARRPVLVETVTMKDLADVEVLKRRLYLFYTASDKYGWEFQLACYKTTTEALKRFCKRWGVRYSKIWDL